MAKYAIYYSETYAQTYYVEGTDFENAKENLEDAISSGKLDGPDNCVDCEYTDMSDDENEITDKMLDVKMPDAVTGATITEEQIDRMLIHMGYYAGSLDLTKEGYAFYYNQMLNGLCMSDADRYAQLNTVLGYDIGIDDFLKLERYMYARDYDLLEMMGSEADRKLVAIAVERTGVHLDFSKWHPMSDHDTYSFFENGVEYK